MKWKKKVRSMDTSRENLLKNLVNLHHLQKERVPKQVHCTERNPILSSDNLLGGKNKYDIYALHNKSCLLVVHTIDVAAIVS